MYKAVYPGSFDPPTNGHMDIIERAACFADRLAVGVLANPSKKALFSVEERVELLKQLTVGLKNVEVYSFSGLLVDFCNEIGANIVIRGLRAVTDFEYEFQMALTNRKLSPEIETIFMPTSTENVWVSSSIVKEVAMFNGNFDSMVPELIKKALLEKFNTIGGINNGL